MTHSRLTPCALAFALGVVPALVGPAARGEARENVRTTAYTHTEADHLEHGRKTASGTTLQSEKKYTSAAADWSKYPLGTKFKIEGMDTTFVVDDYGRALVGTETIDIYRPSRSAMNDWGVREVDIKVIEEGDFERSREILAQRTSFAHVRKMLAAIDDRKTPSKGGLFRKPEAKPAPTPAPRIESESADPPMSLAAASPGPPKKTASASLPAPQSSPAPQQPKPAPAPAKLSPPEPPVSPARPETAPAPALAAARTQPPPAQPAAPPVVAPVLRKIRPLAMDLASADRGEAPLALSDVPPQAPVEPKKRAFRPL